MYSSSVFMRIFLLLILSFPITVFSQENSRPVLLSEVLGQLQDTEFVELTPVEIEIINTGFRHCINSELTTLALIEMWEFSSQNSQYQGAIRLLKTKTQELAALVTVRNDKTSAHFVRRLLKMHQIAEEIFSILSKMEFKSRKDTLTLQENAAHILNLLDFSLRVLQKQKASLSIKTLETVEALGKLAKGKTIYTQLNHQGKLLPSKVIAHLDLFMPKAEFVARFTLFTVLADFVSDPNNQFAQPRIFIQDGKMVIVLPYCLTLFGSAKGREPWDLGGPGLPTYLFKLFYEKNLGAKIYTTQDFHQKLLEVQIEVPLAEPIEGHASLAGALSRLEAAMYVRRHGGSLAENYIFLDRTAHAIAGRLLKVQGGVGPQVLRQTVTEILERELGESPQRVIDMDLFLDRLSGGGQHAQRPWTLESISWIGRHLQESILREARRAAR